MEKVPAVGAHYRTMMGSVIMPSCIGLKERRTGNLEIVDLDCYDWDGGKVRFLEEIAE